MKATGCTRSERRAVVINFKSAYQGEAEYEVYDNGENYRIRYRWMLNDSLEKWYNGGRKMYERDVVGQLYFVSTYSGNAISQHVFEAFRQYLQDEWDKYLVHAKERIALYKGDPEIEQIYLAGPASPIVKPGYWDNGWHEVTWR